MMKNLMMVVALVLLSACGADTSGSVDMMDGTTPARDAVTAVSELTMTETDFGYQVSGFADNTYELAIGGVWDWDGEGSTVEHMVPCGFIEGNFICEMHTEVRYESGIVRAFSEVNGTVKTFCGEYPERCAGMCTRWEAYVEAMAGLDEGWLLENAPDGIRYQGYALGEFCNEGSNGPITYTVMAEEHSVVIAD